MKKKELKSGMLVELRNGSRYFVLKDTSLGNVLVNRTESKLSKPFNDFKPDLSHKKDKKFDVVAVYDTPNSMYLMNEDKYVEVWRRYDNARDRICLVRFPSNEEKDYAFLLPKDFPEAKEGDKALVELRRGGMAGVRISKIYSNSTEAIESEELNGVQLPLCRVVQMRTG